MATYRAAYVNYSPMTSPDEAHLTDAELIEAAVAEAYKTGAIGSAADGGWDTEEEFRDALNVGDWTD